MMALIRRSGTMKRLSSKPLQRNTVLKKKGPKTEAWSQYRNQRATNDQDEDGLIKCQDHLIGLPKCGIAREASEMDLHHVKGRNERPDLYLKDSNNVWLTRECHREAHNQR